MNILILSDNYPPEMNANARIFSELSEQLVKEGARVSVITSHPNFPSGTLLHGHKNTWVNRSLQNGVNVIRVKTYLHANKGFLRRSMDFISFGVVSFFFGLFEKKQDFIIGVTPQFFCALSACFLSLFKRKPFVLMLCDLWPDSIVANKIIPKGLLYKLMKALEHFMYQRAKTIAVLSPYFKVYLNKLGIKDSKIIDFISGPTQEFHQREKDLFLLEKYRLTHQFVIGYIGCLGLSQNHEELLTVFKSLKDQPIHLLMIGDGVKRELLNKLKSEYELNNVTLDGPFNAKEIPAYWSICDIAIVPLTQNKTNKTVIPSKTLEAMAMGLPVLLYTPKGEAARFFSDSNAIWHVESGETELLTQVIHRIVQNEDLTIKKQNALEFSKRFSREKQTQALLAHLVKLSGKEKENETI